MSVGAANDIAPATDGFAGTANPAIPDPSTGQFPADATDAALANQGLTSEQASEGAGPPDFTDDDLAFLQSEAVLNYLKQNLPQGFLTEDLHSSRLREFQSTKDREIAQAQRQAEQFKGQFEEHRIASQQLATALQQSWLEAGIEQGSEEWQQRTQALRGALDQVRQKQQYEQMSYEQSVNRLATEQTQEFKGDLDLMGDSFQNPYVATAYKSYMERLRGGQYESPEQMRADRRNLLNWAKQTHQQARVQQPVQQQAAPQQAQPTAATRPAGATRSARGGGGSAPRSYEDYFQAKYSDLIQQHGGEANIPQSAVLALDIEAAQQSYGD